MALPTVNVTGQVLDAGGNPVASAIVTAKLSGADVYGSEYINSTELSFTADALGNFTLAIFPNAIGSLNTSYAIKLKSADGQTVYRTVNCVVPNRACTLASIEGTGPAAPSNTLQSIEYAMNLPFWDQTMSFLSLIKNFNAAVRNYIFPDVSGTVVVLAGAIIAGMASVQADGSLIDRTLTGTANQVIVANGDGVAGNPTFSLPQNIHTGATPSFAGLTLTGALAANGGITVPTGQSITGAGTASISGFASIAGTTIATSGDLTVGGNLIVNGTTATVNSATLNVTDPLVKYANGNTANVIDIGFYGQYQPAATPLFTGLFRDASDGVYKLYDSLQVEPTTTVNIVGAGYAAAALTVGAFNASTLATSGLATFSAGATVASGQTITLAGATVAGAPTWSSTQVFNAGISIPTGQSVTGAGTATVTGFATVSATNLTGTLTTPAQPNVTSLGTLTSLTASGNITNGTITIASGQINQTGTNATADLAINFDGYNLGITQFRNTVIYNGKEAPIATFTGSDKSTTLAGALSLGSNSLTAGAISAGGLISSSGAFAAGTPNISLTTTTAGAQAEIALTDSVGRRAVIRSPSSSPNAQFGTSSGQDVDIIRGGTTISTFYSTGLVVIGTLSATTTISAGGYTVATLPAAGTKGRMAYVTDATAPTYLGALTGGGTVNTPVFDNGTAWVSF